MKPPYVIVLDTWEGHLEVNEAECFAGGVGAFIIRINDTQGHLHKDLGFDKQWKEAESFVRVPYYVYSPWATPEDNFNWLVANMPESPCAFIDTELSVAGESPEVAGVKYNRFLDLARAKWKIIPYTGAWFLPKIKPWPKGSYWWSAYPWIMYPPTRISISWANLKIRIGLLSWPPFNANQCPGTVVLWQCSGDRLILPGMSRACDVSVFRGTIEEFRAWLGFDGPIPAPEPSTDEYIVIGGNPRVNVRYGAATTATWASYATNGDVVHATETVTNGYRLLVDGTYIYSTFLTKKGSAT
jgi:hypothetical protein